MVAVHDPDPFPALCAAIIYICMNDYRSAFNYRRSNKQSKNRRPPLKNINLIIYTLVPH